MKSVSGCWPPSRWRRLQLVGVEPTELRVLPSLPAARPSPRCPSYPAHRNHTEVSRGPVAAANRNGRVPMCLMDPQALAAGKQSSAHRSNGRWHAEGRQLQPRRRRQFHRRAATVNNEHQRARRATRLVSASNKDIKGPHNGATYRLAASRSRARARARSSYMDVCVCLIAALHDELQPYSQF